MRTLQEILQKLKGEPGNPDLNYQAGHILFKEKEFKRAFPYLKKAIKLNPRMIEAYIDIGLVLEKLDETEKAKKIFEKAIKVDPDNSVAKEWLERVVKDGNTVDSISEATRTPQEINAEELDYIEENDKTSGEGK
ncbi:tetratricopeptide repeat protein, partial [bacterium]